MNLQAFHQKEKDYIDKFYLYYLRQSKENTEDFPLEMEEGEWQEQFLAFLDVGGQDS